MTLLVLVRHGESEWNAQRRVQGQAGTGLSAVGRRQADATADWIAATFPDALFLTSDLRRCVETAAPLAAALGREPRHEVGLRERDFGDWTGVLSSDLAALDPERVERWRSGEDVIGEIGGESTPDFTDRVVTTMRRIADEAAGGVAVCVTHGGPVWHGTRALVGLEASVLGPVANCAITQIRVDERPRLLAWNMVSHLGPELLTWLTDANQARAVTPPVGR